MTNALVVDYDLGPPIPAIVDKLLSFEIKTKGLTIENLMHEILTRHNFYELVLIHCNAYNKLDGPFYKPSGRTAEKIREHQEGIVIIGYSPISSRILKTEYGGLFDDYLSLSENLYDGLEGTFKKHKII